MEKLAQPVTLAEAMALMKAERDDASEKANKRFAEERDASDKRFAEAIAVDRIVALAEYEKLRS